MSVFNGPMAPPEPDGRRGLFIAVGDLPDGSATAMRIRLIARALQEGGVPVHVGLVHATTRQVLRGNDRVHGIVDGFSYEYFSGSTIRPTGRLEVARDTVKGILGAARALLRRPPFVLFYTPVFTKLGALVFLATALRIPVFIEMCEVWSCAPRADRHGRSRNLLFAGGRWFETMIPRIATGIIVISDSIRRYFESLGAEEARMYLLPILMDMPAYAELSLTPVGQLTGKTFFFNSGTFSEKDGAPGIADAFAGIARKYPDVFLVFSGNADERIRARLLTLLNDEGVASRVVFTGYLAREELIWCYQNAAALLSCRPDNAFAQYGFPTKLGEYLASGTVVIATRVGDVELYLKDKDNALLAHAGDPGNVSSCMEWVLENRAAAREIGLRGRSVARNNFDYRVHSRALADFIAPSRVDATD